jgi:hypothetical protein
LPEKKKRGPAKLTLDMKSTIHKAFSELGGVKYLVRVGRSDPKTFIGLLGRIVPNEVRLDVQIALDLGAAMIENQKNLERLNTITIDQEPVTPTKPLIINET